MAGDDDSERKPRPSTVRPPRPGTTEEVLGRRSTRPRKKSPPPPKKSPPRSWYPPPHTSWPTLPAAEQRVPEYPALFLEEDTDPAMAVVQPPSEPPPPPSAAPLARRVPTPAPIPTQPKDPRTEDGRAVHAERAVASIDALHSAIPEPLPPDREQRIKTVVKELAASGPESDGPIRKRVLAFGPECLPMLSRAFPGRLWIDLNRPHRPIRAARHLSGCASAMVAFGDAAVPHVALLLRAPRPEVRLAACVVASDLMSGELVRPLAARLQDELAVVRNAAMLALRASALLPEARMLRSELIATVEDTDKKKEWRRKAAWTIGQLRDAEAVPHLIELLSDSDVSDTARQSLLLLLGRDHGRFQFRWRGWWKKHGTDGRALWLIDALDQKDADLRARAAEELVLLTGEGFDARHATTTREQARELGDRYAAWIEENGDAPNR